jgi:lipoprotein-releasing system ATP-binding protein
MAESTVLEVRGITKVYGTVVKTQVLHEISLAFGAGSFNSIIGQSGSGKSTLMNIMGTLDLPSSGEVYINQQRTDQMSQRELAKMRNQTIGFIFQFHYLLPEFSCAENVVMPYRIAHKHIPAEVQARAEELLEIVGLTRVKNNNALAMSGGQQQRTAIARALLNNPKIVLADEPTGNLDSRTTEEVFDLMRDLNREFGTTFIVITHDQRIAEQTDRIIEISDGRVAMDVRK